MAVKTDGGSLRGRYNKRCAPPGKPLYMTFRNYRRSTNRRQRITFGLVTLILVFASVEAAEVASLFTAQVPFDERKQNPRDTAYKKALAEVLLRISGPELVNDPVMFESVFPNPGNYVVQYRPGEDDTLWVTFDGEAVENTLRQSGQNVWGADRPVTLVWLAVDWGRGVREIVTADNPDGERQSRSVNRNRRLRQRILDIAERRGLPVLFPLLDSEDMGNVEFSDIWGGFNERIVEASKRYDTNSILIGRVRASAADRNRWTYLFSGREREWTGEPEVVIAQISDMLASEFAIAGNDPLRTVQVYVSGINSVEAYGSVQQMLAEMSLIDDYSVTEVAGDTISFRVNARGGAARLARALRFEGLIEQERIDLGDSGVDHPLTSLDFFYSP